MFGWFKKKEEPTVKEQLRALGVVGPVEVVLYGYPEDGPVGSGMPFQVELARYDQYIDFGDIK
jgi:hypothetical protein